MVTHLQLHAVPSGFQNALHCAMFHRNHGTIKMNFWVSWWTRYVVKLMFLPKRANKSTEGVRCLASGVGSMHRLETWPWVPESFKLLWFVNHLLYWLIPHLQDYWLQNINCEEGVVTVYCLGCLVIGRLLCYKCVESYEGGTFILHSV